VRSNVRYRGYQRCSSIDYANGHNVFFVTICVKPRRPAFVTPERNATLVSQITRIQEEGFWGVYLYCIMPDHVHLVVNPGPRGLPDAVRRFKGRVATWWRRSGDGRTLWQAGFFDHRLRNGESYTDKCRYVMENPVRAKLAARAEEYPWTGSMCVWTGS
jgi:putative transposase